MTVNKIKLGVIFGGMSSEHEVSLASARSLLEAVDRDRYQVTELGILKNGCWVTGEGAHCYLVSQAEQTLLPVGMEEVLRLAYSRLTAKTADLLPPAEIRQAVAEALQAKLEISRGPLPEFSRSDFSLSSLDVVFPVLHGLYGEDGTIQGLLEIAQVAIVGCGVLASAVAMDKIITKEVLASVDVPQVRWFGGSAAELLRNTVQLEEIIQEKLGGFPVFVKPANLGSSFGISKVKHPEELLAALRFAAAYDRRLLIEEAISGRELEIAVLGHEEIEVSPVLSEIIPYREFYDYEAKYFDAGTRIELPAQVSPQVLERAQELARRAFRAIDGCGMARIDFFYRERTDELLLSEINTIPGFTRISQYPALMLAAGYNYQKLIDRLIDIALKRREELSQLKM